MDSSITDTNVGSATADCTNYDPVAFLCSGGSASAYKTIADINTKTFSADDQVLFRKGQTWREQLTVPSSGTSGHSITFGAFGSGANPKILGSAAVSTWTNNSVPTVTADLLSESFDATGAGGSAFTTAGTGRLDNSGWTGTVGAGSTLNADSIDIADSAGGSTEILKIQKVSPNWAAWATKDLGADKPISYTQFYAYVSAEGLGNSQQLTLLHATDTAGNHVIDMNFRQNADGTYHFVPARYTGGVSTTGTASGNVNLNTWYKIEIKYDKTNLLWEWKLDGATVDSGSLIAAASNGIRNIRIGSQAVDGFTLTAYLDALKISSTGYPNAGSTGNTWKASYTATPAEMWFVDSGGTPHIGRLVANDAAALSTYDWFTDGVNAYVNSGGTTSGFDPDTLWSSEEASVRNYGMFINTKSNITVQDIDVSYVASVGLFLWDNSDNAIIQRCNTSYNYSDGIAGGVNGTSAPDNALITLNTSAYNGHRGISFDDYQSNWTISYNITHDNAQDYLQNFGAGIAGYGPNGGGQTIEYNTSYSNGTANSSLGNAIGAGIWIDTVAEILGGTSATIRYNTTYGNRYHGIFIEKSSNATIYNNLSYNNADGVASVAGLAVDAYVSHAASNDLFYNNTIYGNYIGIRLRSDQSLSGQISNNTFKNNISAGNTLRQFSAIFGADNAGVYGSGNVYSNNAFGPESSNFIEWGSGVYKSTYATLDSAYGSTMSNVQTDPLFTNPAGSDFTLQSTSPAIDTGVNLGSTYQLGLSPSSTWSSGVVTLNQNTNGLGWDIGAYVYPASPPPPATTVSAAAPISFYPGQRTQTVTVTKPNLPTPLITPTLQISSSFTTNHQLWDIGPDIKNLQVYLNTHGFVIASTGAGSLNHETSTLGPLTFKALIKYQKSKGLPPTGWFGPMTRQYISRH